MPLPAIPPPLAQVGRRRFAFYPAIANIRPNEWTYLSATWSEVLVRNAKTHEEIVVPRRFLGDFSRLDSPVMMVRLLKKLEFQGGAVIPAQPRVIAMPLRTANPSREPGAPAPVVAIRLERSGSRFLKLVAGGVAGCVLIISLYRGGVIATRAFYSPAQNGRMHR